MKIATIDADAIMLEASSNPKKYLEVLRTLKQLKVLQFENLKLVSSRDTFFEFASNISDPTVNVVLYGLDLSPYSILFFLDAFEELEILELNFLDNEAFYKVCHRDFGWAVLRENIDQEMILELFDCWRESTSDYYGNVPAERFSMWNWIQIEEEELLLVPKMMIPSEVRIEENPWESEDSLSDEEYCKLMPDFCDDFEEPFWDRNTEEIDTAFLIIMGEWPLENKITSVDACWLALQENPRWNAYQEKCAELDELYWTKEDGGEALYKRLSVASQMLVEAKKEETMPVLEQASQRSFLIQQLYYQELWDLLDPWNVKTRSELFLEQLTALKKLKKLSISNNYMLDVEELIDLIAKELPNLEVLEFSNCKLYTIPSNINKLQKLTVLNLDNNLIQNASIIQLPNLAILSLKGNEIIEQEARILKNALPNCSLRF